MGILSSVTCFFRGTVAGTAACRSRTNSDDRFSVDLVSRVESGHGIVEARDLADIRTQPSVTHSPDDFAQLGAIGYDDEVDRQAVNGSRLRRPGDGYQRSSSSNQACGPLPDLAAEHIENQIDSFDIFQVVVLKVDELLRAELECPLTVRSASAADDMGARLTCELDYHRTDCTGRAVHED